MQKFVAEAIVEGAVKAGGTAVRMQHSETFNLVVPVDQQLSFVAINADQDHILHDCAHIAAKQLVGYSISEKLQRGTTSPTVKCGAVDVTLSTSFCTFVDSNVKQLVVHRSTTKKANEGSVEGFNH